MRHCPHQTVSPVVAAQRHLLFGRKLQTPVRPEMNQGVRLETVLHPQIGSNIRVRGRHVRAVHHLERVVPRPGGVLRRQHHVSELQARHAQPSVRRRHITARELPVGCHHLRILLRPQGSLYPRFILLFRNQFRMTAPHKLVESPLGIRTENSSLRHNHLLQFLMTGRQSLHTVPLRLHPPQQVVKRRSHLHTARRHGILPGSLVVINRHPLLAIRLLSQIQVIIHILHKRLQTLRHGKRMPQPLLVLILRKQGIRAECPVDFGRHHALRQETARHAHRICLPLLHEAIHRQRRKQQDILLLQELHHPVAHTPVRHIDDGIGLDFL